MTAKGELVPGHARLIALVGLLVSGVVLLASTTCWAQEGRGAPFRIPQDGNQEELVGGLDYEAPSALAFDSRNRPYMFHTREPGSFGYILTLRNGEWERLSYLEILRQAYPKLILPSGRHLHAIGTITVDDAGGLYAVLQVRKTKKTSGYTLLYSPDLGQSFQVYDLPGTAFLEVRVGHNDVLAPPAIGLLKYRKAYPTRWTSYHHLSVLLPERKGDRLDLRQPIPITEDCFGISNHSGGYSFAVTTGRKTHLVYAEIPEKPEGGNPTYVATIDRVKRQVTGRKLLVTATPKKADVHSTPVIVADKEGHLHVIAGSHGQHFYYLRSDVPDTIEDGFSEPSPMAKGQTYATLICDGNDELHSVFRVHPRLLYQEKTASSDTWSKPKPLVRAPRGHKGYTIFYHRLFIDRAGALYLSFTFFEFNTTGKGRYPRALALSEDGGKTWRLATRESFVRRIRAHEGWR
ncbi:BNR-4 repeat-containing protein [Planctomycetota bacterium]